MATQNNERVKIISSFSGGEQRRTTKFLRKDDELNFAENVDLSKKIGAITKSLGYDDRGSVINSGSNNLGSGSLNTSTGTDKIVAFSGTDAYVHNTGTNAWDAQSQGFTADQRYETARFLNMLFVVNGITDAPRVYTGASWSTTTNVTDMPKGYYVIEYNFRLYVLNISLQVGGAFASRVWFSDLPKNNGLVWGFEAGTDLVTTSGSAVITSAGSLFQTRNIKIGDPLFITTGSDIGEYEVLSIDSETQITLTKSLTATTTAKSFWVGGNWFDVARDNSDVGMGLGKNSDRLLIFKRRSLYKFQKGTDEFTDNLIEVKGVPGTVNNRSIVNLRDWTFYWSDAGLMRYDGTTSQLISAPVQDYVDGIDPDEFDNICGWVENDRVIKMFVGNITNTDADLALTEIVICYDAFSGVLWHERINTLPRSNTTFVEGNIIKNYIFSNDGYCLQTATGNEHFGVAISMEVEAGPYFPISPEVAVNFSRFKIYTQNGQGITTMVRYYYVDGKIDSDWREVETHYKTRDEQEVVPKETEPRASGIEFRFVESSTDNSRPAIERIAIFYSGGELR